MNHQAVIFDLDGTLLNTLEDLTRATNHVLAEHDLAPITMTGCRSFVGQGARNLLRRAIGIDGEALDQALQSFLAFYYEHMLEHTHPYDGIEPLLDALQARDMPIAILSNKPHAATTKMVQAILPGRPFVDVLGQRDGVPLKPDPTAALSLAQQLDLPPERVALMGDSGVDMATAKAAGMLAVGVTWGLRDEPDLHEHGVDVVIHHPMDLLDVI